MTDVLTSRQCSLELAVGGSAACPEEACPFWEPGGAVLDGRCSFEQFDVAGRPSLAALLLELRERFDSAASDEELHAELTHFHHLLNESSE